MKKNVKVFYKSEQRLSANKVEHAFAARKWQTDSAVLSTDDQVKASIKENAYRFLIVINPTNSMTIYDSMANTVTKKALNDWSWMEVSYESRH